MPGGIQVQVVRLSRENGWTHTWEDMPRASQWGMKEINVPKGYRARYSVSGYNVTVKNVYRLAQTGLDWRRVAALGGSGLTLAAVGLWLRRLGRKE